jgi:hypothetical protein
MTEDIDQVVFVARTRRMVSHPGQLPQDDRIKGNGPRKEGLSRRYPRRLKIITHADFAPPPQPEEEV